MISVIIAFRLPPKEHCTVSQIETVEEVFSYWKDLKLEYGLDLVFVNDFSEQFWLMENFIHQMTGDRVDWNMGAARNFGASKALGDKMLFTDIDHLVFGDFSRLDTLDLNKKYFKLERVALTEGVMQPMKHHTNTFIMKKDEFISYDEDFGGNYGYEDTEFFHRLNQTHFQGFLSKEIVFSAVLQLPRVKLNRDKTINKLKLIEKTGIAAF